MKLETTIFVTVCECKCHPFDANITLANYYKPSPYVFWQDRAFKTSQSSKLPQYISDNNAFV